MGNDLIKLDENLANIPTSHEMQAIQVMAQQCSQSGFYKRIGGPAQLFAIALTARELGLPIMGSLNGGINIIQGKVELSARYLNLLIRRAGGQIKVKKLDKSGCWISGLRKDTGEEMEVSFTSEDAKAAGLLGNANWQKYLEDMLWARALSRLGRRLWPDVIGPIYVEGEISDVQLDTVSESPKQEEPVKEAAQPITTLDPELSSEETKKLIDSMGEEAPLFTQWLYAVSEMKRKPDMPSPTLEQVAYKAKANWDVSMEHFKRWKAKQV